MNIAKLEIALHGKILVTQKGCWLWQGGTKTSDGYGQLWDGGKHIYIHRLAFELQKGILSSRSHIHHLCHHKTCVNPEHMIPVTNGQHQNITVAERKQGIISPKDIIPDIVINIPCGPTCKNGHLWVDNEYWTAGRRSCRACQREFQRRYDLWRRKGIRVGVAEASMGNLS